jgi:hypothetical protein
MELAKAVRHVFSELEFFIENISNEEYTRPITLLTNSSLGQHVRHILEFFICLNRGYEMGVVDYDRRNRDKRIECDKDFARAAIHDLLVEMEQFDHHQPIVLQMSYDREGSQTINIMTNYQRELAYNIEHSVHHMALIRIGLKSVAPDLNLSNEFGVAVSTLRHQGK